MQPDNERGEPLFRRIIEISDKIARNLAELRKHPTAPPKRLIEENRRLLTQLEALRAEKEAADPEGDKEIIGRDD